MRHWRLPEVETPNGARSPAVLHSRDGSERAVLIELRAGEALGDHRVESVDAERQTLLHFEPDEMHSVASDDGARLLLLLAPWPGEGHYRGDRVERSGVSAS